MDTRPQPSPDSAAPRSLHVVVTVAIATTGVILDQATKWIAAAALAPDHPVVLIPGVLKLSLRANPHGAFGLFAAFSEELRLPILLALSVLAMVAIITFSIRTLGWSKAISVSLGFILGGALSNLADRIGRGEVLDFVDVSIGSNFRWPTFNLADVAITIGSLILAGSLIRTWVRRARLERAG